MSVQHAQSTETARPGWARGPAGRVLLVVLTLWGLAMIVPDLYRVFDPLASFGLSIDNDGLVTDVREPFASEAQSPAGAAGIVSGDRVDLQAMRCVPLDADACDDIIILLGGLAGLHYVLPGTQLDLALLPRDGTDARALRLAAARPAWDALDSFVLLAATLVGVAVVLTAAWLVWRRPGAMTWGFFCYVLWINPGQTYAYYALLTPWPLAVLAQELAEAVAQAAAYVGLLVFALRFPHDTTEPFWRPVERALPLLMAALVCLNLASFANAFGYPTETITRWTIYAGMALDVAVLAILLVRRRLLAPADEQRMRWVIAGCAIGLPAFFIAELAQSAALFDDFWGGVDPPQALLGLLFLVSGVLSYFVFEAVRRPRVISVAIPLRHGTVMAALTIVTAIPVFFAHEWLGEHMDHVAMPKAVLILVIGPLIVLALSQVHERVVHLAGHAFSRRYHRAQHCLEPHRRGPAAGAQPGRGRPPSGPRAAPDPGAGLGRRVPPRVRRAAAPGRRRRLGRGVADGARPGGGRRRAACHPGARAGPADARGLGPCRRAGGAGAPLRRGGRPRRRGRAAGRGALRPAPRRQRSRPRRACDAGHAGRAGRGCLRAGRDRGAPARDRRAAGAAGGAAGGRPLTVALPSGRPSPATPSGRRERRD